MNTKNSLSAQLKKSPIPSEKIFYKFIRARAKELGVKLSDPEIEEFFKDAYWSLDDDLDIHFHNVKAFD